MPPMYRNASQKKDHGRRPKRSLRARFRRWWIVVKILLVAAVVGAVVLGIHMRRIDKMIEDRFDRPRKWNLPSRVYADAEYIYPGTDINAREIVAKLDRLGYRDVGTAIKTPGDYARAANRLDVYLHDFAYPFESFTGFPVRLVLDGKYIASIENLESRERLEFVQLEPEEIASIFDIKMESRTFVTLDEVPQQLVEAVILIEDERFLKHKGIDPVGILRAAVVNVAHMRVMQGGSTLTQQLVKNFFLYPKRSILRKINEALIAIQIERRHDKREILQAYLNEIYLGQRGSSSIAGVGEAARAYFAKDVGQLTLGECAMLAGMIRSPNNLSPARFPDKAAERRAVVLNRMLEKGFITKAERDTAAAESVITPKISTIAVRAPYFIDFVKTQLVDLYPQQVLESEGLRIFTTLDMTLQRHAERGMADGLAGLEKDYAARLPKDAAGQLQGALVAIRPSNGYVRALVGGRSYADSQYNRATQARRQPGSTFKPFVYLTAFDPKRAARLFTPSSIIDDAPFTITAGGKAWTPNNYDKKSHGLVSARQALYNSYNVATSRVALMAGLKNVAKTARDAGMTGDIPAVPSMALGAIEVSPLELAAAYTVFPNNGMRAQPLSIINVLTKDGDVLERKRLNIQRAFDPGPIYLTTSAMKDVLDRGTGRRARSLGFGGVAAGKTGTTSNYRDAWFAGFTPNLLALVWVGYDDNASMGLSGSSAALPLWTQFMKQAAPEGTQDFPSPSNIILVKINPPTGLLVNRHCPDFTYEPFIEGTEPETACDEFVPPIGEKLEF